MMCSLAQTTLFVTLMALNAMALVMFAFGTVLRWRALRSQGTPS